MAQLDDLQAALKASEKEAERLKTLIAEEQQKGPEVLALYGALKEVTAKLKARAPELVPAPLADMPGQQWPKEKYVGMKQYGMSETEIHSAVEKGKKAISGL